MAQATAPRLPVSHKPAPEAIDDAALRATVDEIVSRRAAVGLAVGIVRNGKLEFFHAHGLAHITTETPITRDTIFRIASISKTFTAIAVMQLWEEGLIDLDAPANEYLRAFKLIPVRRGGRDATVRDLLTHTSGIPEMVHPSRALGYIYGESYALDEPVPALGDYYRGGIRLKAEPGTRFTYTDHNFSTLGQIVEDVSGKPIALYLRERIFEPLGMLDTDLRRTYQISSRLAEGYNLTSHGPKAVTDRQWLTAAASMVYSSPRDMSRYLAALMSGGKNEHGSIVKAATLATMFAAQYQPDPRIPGIGLAFDRGDFAGHPAVFHEGILPGFNSQIFVAPEDQVGVMAFTNGARGAMFWLPAETGRLLSQVLGVRDATVRTDVPQHPEVWGEVCGWYPVSAPLTEMRMRAMLGLGAQVFVRQGELRIRIVTPIPVAFGGFVLHPDDPNDPFVFRIDLSALGAGSGRVAFAPDPVGRRARVSFDLLPISLVRMPAPKTQLWAGGLLLAAALAAGLRGRRRS